MKTQIKIFSRKKQKGGTEMNKIILALALLLLAGCGEQTDEHRDWYGKPFTLVAVPVPVDEIEEMCNGGSETGCARWWGDSGPCVIYVREDMRDSAILWWHELKHCLEGAWHE